MENEFLKELKEIFIFSRSSEDANRSSTKVDRLHGIISKHLNRKLGDDYVVETKETTGAETKIQGRYIKKSVDITLRNIKTNKIVAGIGVKMPINTFGKNRINYFENLLGETANIRTNNIPYFQIIILPITIPEWKTKSTQEEKAKGIEGRRIKSYYTFDESKFELYKKLSQDNALSFYHTPLKTLLLVVDDRMEQMPINTSEREFNSEYRRNLKDKEVLVKTIELEEPFDTNVIFNEYEKFLDKVNHLVKGFD